MFENYTNVKNSTKMSQIVDFVISTLKFRKFRCCAFMEILDQNRGKCKSHMAVYRNGGFPKLLK